MKELIGKQIDSVWLCRSRAYMAFSFVDGSTVCYQAVGD
jgi:hypothetical protein